MKQAKVRLQGWVTPEEARAVKAAASWRGWTISEYLRRAHLLMEQDRARQAQVEDTERKHGRR